MKKERKHRTESDKVAILRRRLLDGISVSDLWDQY